MYDGFYLGIDDFYVKEATNEEEDKDNNEGQVVNLEDVNVEHNDNDNDQIGQDIDGRENFIDLEEYKEGNRCNWKSFEVVNAQQLEL